MSFAECLTPHRVLFLKARTKRQAFEELAERLAEDSAAAPTSGTARTSPARVDAATILEEIWKRETFLSTRVAPNIAIPHAIIRGMRGTLIAIGISRKGISYEDTKEDLPVQILVMLVGNEREHLQILSEIASRLNNPNLCRDLLIARSSADAYELLSKPYLSRPAAQSGRSREASDVTVRHAIALAADVGASRIVLHADAVAEVAELRELASHPDIILVTTDPERFSSLPFDPKNVVAIPFKGANRSSQVEITLLFLLSQGFIGKGERIVSITGTAHSGVIDSIFFTDVDREFKLYFAIESEERPDDLDQQVLTRVLQIASDLAIEGREGKPVGTLFIVGDYENVRTSCQQLIVNPFRGYREEERNILDPSLEDTIKEYSRIDGAFVIRGDGVIMSAGTYIKADASHAQLHSGLGARHAAAATITAITGAIAVAISESTQKISLFRAGERFLHF